MSSWARSAVLGVLVTSACSSGGGDLNQLTENPKPVGNPIARAGAPESRLPDGQTIKAQGVVVTAVDTYDETKDGKGIGDIYVQDAVQTGAKGTPWSGLKLYRHTKNPPDLDLVPGHGVDLPVPGNRWRALHGDGQAAQRLATAHRFVQSWRRGDRAGAIASAQAQPGQHRGHTRIRPDNASVCVGGKITGLHRLRQAEQMILAQRQARRIAVGAMLDHFAGAAIGLDPLDDRANSLVDLDVG